MTTKTRTSYGSSSSRRVWEYACKAALEALYTEPKTYGTMAATEPILRMRPLERMRRGVKACTMAMMAKKFVSKQARASSMSTSRPGMVQLRPLYIIKGSDRYLQW